MGADRTLAMTRWDKTLKEMEMTIQEILTAINSLSDADKKSLSAELLKLFPNLGTATVKAEDVATYLESDDGKKLIQSKIDAGITTGVNTFRDNNFKKEVDKAVEEKIKELNPDETPEQKENRENRRRIEELEATNKRNELKNTAMMLISEKKLPFTNIIDNLLGKDIDGTKNIINGLADVFESEVNKRVKEKLEGRTVDLGDGEGEPDWNLKNPWSREHFHLGNQGKVLKSNPELAAKLKKAAGY